MTHFANADDVDDPLTNIQVDRFRPLLEGFDGAVSIANSPGALGFPELADAIPYELVCGVMNREASEMVD